MKAKGNDFETSVALALATLAAGIFLSVAKLAPDQRLWAKETFTRFLLIAFFVAPIAGAIYNFWQFTSKDGPVGRGEILLL